MGSTEKQHNLETSYNPNKIEGFATQERNKIIKGVNNVDERTSKGIDKSNKILEEELNKQPDLEDQTKQIKQSFNEVKQMFSVS